MSLKHIQQLMQTDDIVQIPNIVARAQNINKVITLVGVNVYAIDVSARSQSAQQS